MPLVIATVSENGFALNLVTKLTLLLNHNTPTNLGDACREGWHK